MNINLTNLVLKVVKTILLKVNTVYTLAFVNWTIYNQIKIKNV